MDSVPRMSRPSSIGSKGSGSKSSNVKSGGSGRILHLDPFSGIAGNMFLAALLDLGLSRRDLDRDLAGLGIDYKLRVSKVQRGALVGRYVDVRVPGTKRVRKPKRSAKPHDHHAHDGGWGQHATDHDAHAHAHGKSYKKIRTLLNKAKLEAPIRNRALAIFEALAIAEANVHGVKPEQVHFHEVGAIDAIVDVTGAAIGLHRLEIERVTSAPVALGHGTVQTDHGRLPLPAPATLELLRGVPTVPAHVAWETVTPTGAAILRTIVEDFTPLPAMTVQKIGHGAGDDRPGPMPNLLRAVLGTAGEMNRDRILSLESNLDDLIPEHFDYLMERLFEAGALDVSLQNIQMKKNRPGFLLRVLARPVQRVELAQILMAESTTLGVRIVEYDRIVLERESHKVSTAFGRIGVKFVKGVSGTVDVSAEYDDCKRVARKHGVSLREVVRRAEDAARETLV
jgi:uncharacterized protein (TIGR00299 family) protein